MLFHLNIYRSLFSVTLDNWLASLLNSVHRCSQTRSHFLHQQPLFTSRLNLNFISSWKLLLVHIDSQSWSCSVSGIHKWHDAKPCDYEFHQVIAAHKNKQQRKHYSSWSCGISSSTVVRLCVVCLTQQDSRWTYGHSASDSSLCCSNTVGLSSNTFQSLALSYFNQRLMGNQKADIVLIMIPPT